MGEFQTISAITGRPIEPARARTSHPQTSHDAAARVNVTNGQELVLRALRHMARNGEGAATGDRVRDYLRSLGFKASDSGPRSRCAELRDVGLTYVVRHAGGVAVYSLTSVGKTRAEELARAANAEKGRIAA